MAKTPCSALLAITPGQALSRTDDVSRTTFFGASGSTPNGGCSVPTSGGRSRSLLSFSVAALAAIALLQTVSACDNNELSDESAKTQATNITLSLPDVPDFVAPEPNADGSHPVAELRLNGIAVMDTEITAVGTIIWIYDCAADVRTPEMSDKEFKTLIEKNPKLCGRPYFKLGEDASANPDRGIYVVEYPRPFRKDQKKARTREEFKANKALVDAMPAFKVGDEVAIIGQWTRKSPLGFGDTNGLIVYKSMINKSTPTEPAK